MRIINVIIKIGYNKLIIILVVSKNKAIKINKKLVYKEKEKSKHLCAREM